MKKNVFGRQFKRDRNERKALFKSLLSSLVLYERIQTTEEKAKAIKGQADKLVTKVKKQGKNASSSLQVYLTPSAIEKLIIDVAPRFVKRQGGYTRFVRSGHRVSDNAAMAYLEWTEIKEEPSLKTVTKKENKEETTSQDKKEATVTTEKNAAKKTTKKTQTKKTDQKKQEKK